MPLTIQQFEILKTKLQAALADQDTPADVVEQLRDWARRYPQLGIQSEEDLFQEARTFFLSDPATWTRDNLIKYGTWVSNNLPEGV